METSDDKCQCEGKVQGSHESPGENQVSDKWCKFTGFSIIMTLGTKVYIVSSHSTVSRISSSGWYLTTRGWPIIGSLPGFPEVKNHRILLNFARKLLYSSNSEESGVDCGKVHNIFLKVSSLITNVVKGTCSVNIYQRIDQKKESEINF